MKRIREIIEYREMVFRLVQQDLKGKYKGSVLGFLWTFLNPLLQLVVYTFVFNTIMKQDIEDFYIFLFVAFVPWLFISTSVSGGSRAVIDRKDLVKKIYFPRQILPLAYVTGGFVNLLLSFVVVFGALIFSGRTIHFNLLWYLIPIMIVEYLFCLGITMITSALTVFFRDLEYILTIITMVWMYLTPIMYPKSLVPVEFQTVYNLNPVTPIIDNYRFVLYYGEAPRLESLCGALMIAFAMLLLGNIVFEVLQRRFAEEL